MKIRNVNALLLKVLLFGAVASCDSGSESKEEQLGDLMDRADETEAWKEELKDIYDTQ